MVMSLECIIIQTDEDLNKLLSKYNCKTVDDLADTLFHEYGTTVVDDRDAAEYSQVNAQQSFEFYDEALTDEELQERKERR